MYRQEDLVAVLRLLNNTITSMIARDLTSKDVDFVVVVALWVGDLITEGGKIQASHAYKYSLIVSKLVGVIVEDERLETLKEFSGALIRDHESFVKGEPTLLEVVWDYPTAGMV